ncbi:hypothetical protein FACS1894184_16430 [Clostridia bacterium]|nr:hypothetical protein FACS1894184_16430 [Clostridia bacterium]
MNEFRRTFGVSTTREKLGVAGERGVAILIVDVSSVIAEWSNSRFAVIIKRAQAPPWPVEGILTAESGVLIWPVCAYATSTAGEIDIEIQARSNGVTVKSFAWPFKIAASLAQRPGSGCQPCMPQPGWVDEVLDAAQSILECTDNCGDNVVTLVRANSFADLPTVGDTNTLYLVNSGFYTWNAVALQYDPVLWDADNVNLIFAGKQYD